MEVTFFSLMRTSEFTSFFLKEVLDFKTFRLGPQLIAVTMNMIHAKKGMGWVHPHDNYQLTNTHLYIKF